MYKEPSTGSKCYERKDPDVVSGWAEVMRKCGLRDERGLLKKSKADSGNRRVSYLFMPGTYYTNLFRLRALLLW